MGTNCDICWKPVDPRQGLFGGIGNGDRFGPRPGNLRHYSCHVDKYGKTTSLTLTSALRSAHTQQQIREVAEVREVVAPQVKTPIVTKGPYNRSENASREFKVLARYSEHGRTSIRIECPFCFARFLAFVWSISGGGKKCPNCGAKHASFGLAYPIEGNEDL